MIAFHTIAPLKATLIARSSCLAVFRLSGMAFLTLASCQGGQREAPPIFSRVHSLAPEEGVFAYSRISPNGRYIAYSSESASKIGNAEPSRTVTIVDLTSSKILFREEGIDAYWSVDGGRVIYLSHSGEPHVALWHLESGFVQRNVAPTRLGDYNSWGLRDGQNVILTINSNYYFLRGDSAIMPHQSVPACPGFGRGERPLLSKDGRRISTFVRGTVVVRALDNCDDIIETGIEGAKSDFSFDGRYIAMHAPKPNGIGYDIFVVDLVERAVRTITSHLPGSSLFPSWTEDGRISFRYDAPDYHGFIIASNVLVVSTRPLPSLNTLRAPVATQWDQLFPETIQPQEKLILVLVWGTWSSHSTDALRELNRTRRFLESNVRDVSVAIATDAVSTDSDIARMLLYSGGNVRRIQLAPERMRLTGLQNQNPATLLFRDGQLIGTRLGLQTFEQLTSWIAETRGD